MGPKRAEGTLCNHPQGTCGSVASEIRGVSSFCCLFSIPFLPGSCLGLMWSSEEVARIKWRIGKETAEQDFLGALLCWFSLWARWVNLFFTLFFFFYAFSSLFTYFFLSMIFPPFPFKYTQLTFFAPLNEFELRRELKETSSVLNLFFVHQVQCSWTEGCIS